MNFSNWLIQFWYYTTNTYKDYYTVQSGDKTIKHFQAASGTVEVSGLINDNFNGTVPAISGNLTINPTFAVDIDGQYKVTDYTVTVNKALLSQLCRNPEIGV